ncbi:type III-D CRISPR-associated protein Csx19 [Plantactinospora sp. WMMC1484]|uniref:type III-D CRISPR-associated protein Csx19 n=1 Tax=Plantactinospora sp. WMMC1484 TaxID=3404122 RepID=UPI003BF4839B
MSSVGRVISELGDCPADQALRTFVDDGSAGVGFCYRPADARWFRFGTDGVPRGADGTALDLTGVFELRAFSTTEELRWRHRSAGSGTAIRVRGLGPQPHERLLREHERLLWGNVVGPAPGPGWVALHDARIGVLHVPVDTRADGRVPVDGDLVWLRAVEYVEEDRHGNAAVVDEQLVGLVARPHPAEHRSRGGEAR